jgi:dTDP-4-dehydrorhamnose reductase
MNRRKKLLVTGASGFLGWNICRVAAGAYDVVGITHSKTLVLPGTAVEKCDITRSGDLRAIFGKTKPDAVIHAAAIASPNVCQEHAAESRRVNLDASISIASLCSDWRIPCVFTSTDLVFDGTAAPYNEERPVSPISVYGEQKVKAEIEMRARHGDLRACRMPLMFGDAIPPAQSFIHPFIATMREGKELTLFTDEYRTPLSANSAVEALLLSLTLEPGTYHCGGRERITRYGFGLKLAKALDISNPKIKGVSQKSVVSTAPRPLDVSLDSSKMFGLGFRPGLIEDELAKLACVHNRRV